MTPNAPKIAWLEVDRSCSCCWKFRLRDTNGAVVWRNRTYPHAEGEQGARGRMTAWALRFGWTIVDHTQQRIAA